MASEHILRNISKSRETLDLKLGMPQKAEIWTIDAFQKCLGGYRGVFRNLDFLPPFWSFLTPRGGKMAFLGSKTPEMRPKNQNFKKSLCTPQTLLKGIFGPNFSFLRAKIWSKLASLYSKITQENAKTCARTPFCPDDILRTEFAIDKR